ncbi:hypothetical protein DITRI_Ditri01bG0045400 [Diplodiscus trichospermus]
MWGSDVNVKPAGVNLFIILFSDVEARDKVLEEGPWHVQNKPLIVRKWEPGLTTLDLDFSRIPLWVHLSNVPLELFTKEGLSYIASAIGNPLYMDRIIAAQQRLAYAKICVELDVNLEVPDSIEVQMKDGTLITIWVETPWYPLKRQVCNSFGHSSKYCAKKEIKKEMQKWVPKKKNEEKKELVAGENSQKPGDEEEQISKPVIENKRAILKESRGKLL